MIGFKQKGFAVLITVMMLSVIGLLYALNMAHSQLIDNRILGNVFRNNEALANAESGVHLILNKLSHIKTAEQIVQNLPFTYSDQQAEEEHYQVAVNGLGNTQLQITSTGYSQDKTAIKVVSLQVQRIDVFDIPVTAVSSNGQLKINPKGVIDTGCEGLDKESCHSSDNVADQAVISQTPSEKNGSSFCRNDLQSPSLTYTVKHIVGQQWGKATSFVGTLFEQIRKIDDTDKAASLFQSTFGIHLNDAKDTLTFSNKVANIDMTTFNSLDCSEQLRSLDDDINIIYIKGDCNIDVKDSAYNDSPDTKHFAIGSIKKPKMVFFEGGTFIKQPDIHVSINGMLYFIPATHDLLSENGDFIYIDDVKQTVTDQIIDMSGIRVNGALLSEYNCSHNENDKNKTATMQHFSIFYDKTILNTLYGKLGMIALTSYYQLVIGSWRDF